MSSGWIIIILAALGILLMLREMKNAPWFDEETNRFYNTYKELLNARKNHNMKELSIAVFTLPKNIIMYIPLHAIIKIDGYVLLMNPNAGDYTLMRNGVEETAPCVASINIARAVITFE